MNLTNLKRWIKASAVQTLKPLAQGHALFIEGEDRNTNDAASHFELRVDGPYTSPHGTQGEYKAYVEVNVLANSTRNESNVYERENMQGIAAEMLNRDICVYRIGNVGVNPADTGTLVGVLQLMPMDLIKVSDFGKIDDNVEVYQAVAEAHYTMYFSER